MTYEVQLDYAKINKEIANSQFTKPGSPQVSCVELLLKRHALCNEYLLHE